MQIFKPHCANENKIAYNFDEGFLPFLWHPGTWAIHLQKKKKKAFKSAKKEVGGNWIFWVIKRRQLGAQVDWTSLTENLSAFGKLSTILMNFFFQIQRHLETMPTLPRFRIGKMPCTRLPVRSLIFRLIATITQTYNDFKLKVFPTNKPIPRVSSSFFRTLFKISKNLKSKEKKIKRNSIVKSKGQSNDNELLADKEMFKG